MEQKKAAFGIVLLIVIVAGLWVFFSSQPAQPASIKTLKVGTLIYPAMGLLYVAQEKGFFAEEGIDPEIIVFGGWTQTVNGLASDSVDLIHGGSQDAILIPITEGKLDLVQIFNPDTSKGTWGVGFSKEIKDINGLIGKKFFVPIGTPPHLLILLLMQQAGISPKQVSFEYMDGEQVGTAFVSKAIDAGGTWDPWLSEMEKREGAVIIRDTTLPDTFETNVAGKRTVLQEKREEIKAYLRGYLKAVEFWKKNQAEAEQIMAKHLQLSPEELHQLMQYNPPRDYQENVYKFDRQNPKSMYQITQWAVDLYLASGVISTKVDVNRITDDSFVTGLYQ